jgi:hypothetical protein
MLLLFGNGMLRRTGEMPWLHHPDHGDAFQIAPFRLQINGIKNRPRGC